MLPIAQALDLAVKFHKRGQFDQAEDIYRQVLAVRPDDPDTLHLLGVVERTRGNHKEAIRLISRCLDIRPDFAEAHVNLGNALREIGRHQEALRSYWTGLDLRPDLPEALNNVGMGLLDEGRAAEAAPVLRRALAIRPDMAEAHFNLGRVCRRLGQLEDAAAHFRHSLAIRPDQVEVIHMLGSTLGELGRLDAAIDALRLGPSYQWDASTARRDLAAALGGCADPAPPDDRLLLTIAIPTFERRDFLKELLESVLPQVVGVAEAEVEIVISDNGSQDGTEAMCRTLAERHAFLRYDRNPYNAGGPVNVVAAAGKGRGRFTWVIGDDDLVLPGAIGRVLDLIRDGGCAYFLLNKAVRNADFTLTLIDRQCLVDEDRDYDGLLALARDVGLLTNISFLSTSVFRSDLFLARDAAFHVAMNTYYPHLSMFMEGFHDVRCRLVSEPLVVQRVFNMRRSEERRDETISHTAYLNICRMFLYLEDRGLMPFSDVETIAEEQLPKRRGERGERFHWADLMVEGVRQGFIKQGRASRDDLFTLAHLCRVVTRENHRLMLRGFLACMLDIDAVLVRLRDL